MCLKVFTQCYKNVRCLYDEQEPDGNISTFKCKFLKITHF